MSKPPSKNHAVVAAAGSRKTTHLVEQALAHPDRKILITTYTIENVGQIREYFIDRLGVIPKNVIILSWYEFLLREGARPYRSALTERGRIRSADFKSTAPMYAKKDDIAHRFLTSNNNIYKDRVAEFVCLANEKASGAVVKRLERIYDYIYVDEIQDLSGWDLDLLGLIFKSNIGVLLVGDPRQATFSTANTPKNKKFKRANVFGWLKERENEGVLTLTERTDCYRCNQAICDFADQLFPEMPKTRSVMTDTTDHDGVFEIGKADVEDYVKRHQPRVLRFRVDTDVMGLPAMNIGLSKGRTFERVLIFPTKPMREFLRTMDPSKAGDKSKLYVALTRARFSVAFVSGE